jgi:hypothetical protein
MSKRYLVVDQNYLRAPELKLLLEQEDSVRVILPDLAFLEMTKSAQRELTLTQSLAQLCRYRSRVFLGQATSACLQYELAKKQPVSGHLVHRDGTQFIRKVLEAVASGSQNAELLQILNDPDGHIADLKRDYLDHSINKAQSTELVDVTKLDMSTEFARRVRSGTTTLEERLAFVHEKAPSLAVEVLADYGFSREKAVMFIRRKPLLLRYFYLNMWVCLDWERVGRLESMADHRVSNDLLDREYAITATFFDGLLTSEKRMNEAYGAVSRLIEQRV